MSPLVDVTVTVTAPDAASTPVRWIEPADVVAAGSGDTGVLAKVEGGVGADGTAGTKAGLPSEMRPLAVTEKVPPAPPVPSTPGLEDAVPPLQVTERAVTEAATATFSTCGSSWQPARASSERTSAERRREFMKGTLNEANQYIDPPRKSKVAPGTRVRV